MASNLQTMMVIASDCIGSCKTNYYMIIDTEPAKKTTVSANILEKIGQAGIAKPFLFSFLPRMYRIWFIKQCFSKYANKKIGLGLWCLTPLSTIFQLYRDSVLLENTIDLQEVTDKLYHIMLY